MWTNKIWTKRSFVQYLKKHILIYIFLKFDEKKMWPNKIWTKRSFVKYLQKHILIYIFLKFDEKKMWTNIFGQNIVVGQTYARQNLVLFHFAGENVCSQNVLKHMLVLEFLKSDKIFEISCHLKWQQATNQTTLLTHGHHSDQISCSTC